ncbi:MAG: NUDIX hydrolase [Gammaproteobacteria bacterium]|nr:NUDIX hydrolase [Gammaproteobacteria bacterium]
MIWKPHTTVAAVIEKDGKFLIVEEESDSKVVYNQPAGHLDEDESLIQAVIRETLEETAWHFKPENIIGVYQYKSPGNGTTYIRFCFSGQCNQHEPDRKLDDGIVCAIWMSYEELVREKDKLRSPMVLHCIDDYLAGKQYPLELIWDIQ